MTIWHRSRPLTKALSGRLVLLSAAASSTCSEQGSGSLRAMLRIPARIHAAMLAHAIAGLPHEACGLLAGPAADGTAPARNSDDTAKSSEAAADGSAWAAELDESTDRDSGASDGSGGADDAASSGVTVGGGEDAVQDAESQDARLQETELSDFIPMANAAQSAEIYRFADKEYMDAERGVELAGKTLIGVMHSHTRTTAYPSPTDVDDAARFDPFGTWRFVIVSLKHPAPALRCYRILGSEITEERVEVVGS